HAGHADPAATAAGLSRTMRDVPNLRATLLASGLALAFLAPAAPAAGQAQYSVAEMNEVVAEAVKTPSHPESRRVLTLADADQGTKILVSTEQRRLWLISGRDRLMSVTVAVGMGRRLGLDRRSLGFQTPRGRQQVL